MKLERRQASAQIAAVAPVGQATVQDRNDSTVGVGPMSRPAPCANVTAAVAGTPHPARPAAGIDGGLAGTDDRITGRGNGVDDHQRAGCTGDIDTLPQPECSDQHAVGLSGEGRLGPAVGSPRR